MPHPVGPVRRIGGRLLSAADAGRVRAEGAGTLSGRLGPRSGQHRAAGASKRDLLQYCPEHMKIKRIDQSEIRISEKGALERAGAGKVWEQMGQAGRAWKAGAWV
jgi:hypothetical protein